MAGVVGLVLCSSTCSSTTGSSASSRGSDGDLGDPRRGAGVARRARVRVRLTLAGIAGLVISLGVTADSYIVFFDG